MDIANSLSKTIKDSLPDSAQVTNVLKDQSQQFADNVKNIVNQLQSGLNENKGVVDDAIKQASQKLSETVKSLQNAAGPEVTARATEIKQKLDENVKSVAQEIDTLVKAVQPQLNEAGERVSSLTKNVLNEFVESARKLQTKVNEAVNNSQAKKH
ncbi:putative leucine-rich repeat-containing protein DDB_G0290503 [Agrilus planipennis]|uniref:Leucine-rich repeat-containing protein DDB_G0290503 n=1 Tax=Agrilus planipennis TaxID=224129 RepID=A0A1W4XIL3_AGRPL|nr:putative leucine-rich repeat-containing protein DDB_G0290503 [Agrilus planipennis]